MDRCDVVIVGAGPYGLSAAAHLCQLKGLDLRLLGEPMSFWERHTPQGMLLRSPWAGSHIADPGDRLTLDAYRMMNGNHHLADPVPVKDFIRYGHWFVRKAALSVDRRNVMRIEVAPQGYRLILDAGEALHARRVVVAAGIQPFAFRPKIFEHFPASLVTHTSEQQDFAKFPGKEVLVIGGGQSALEAAVFLREAGAQVEVLVRSPGLYWLDNRRWMHAKPIRWMFYGAGEIGPAGASLIIQRPDLFRRLPRRIRHEWSVRAMRPAIAHWLKPRTHNIPIHTERFLVQARAEGERLRVRFNDGTDRLVDHVVLGTGYRLNVALYPFLSSGVLERIDTVDGYPHLDAGFETSLPGLHFLGAPAAWSFGPLMRFVAGTDFASAALQRRILQVSRRPLAFHRITTEQPFESVQLETNFPK
jgi:cation diffusion facilitator CzcD-associated flavoprotein CzcO